MRERGRPMRERERGFTLIEALVALGLFALGIMGVIGAMTSHARIGLDARFRSEASAAADELVARLQTASPATLVADYETGGTAFSAWLTNRLRAAGTGLPGADASVDFSTVGGDARTATIEIRWTPPRTSTRDAAGVQSAQSETHRFRTVVAIVR